MAGVLRGTRRGEGLIGIPFLLLGDSEGKRRVDLEASLSTRSLTVCKVCQTGGKEAGGGRTCDGASSSLLSLEYFFSPWRNFSSSSSLFDEKIDVAKKIKKTRVSIYKFCLRNRRLYLKKKKKNKFSSNKVFRRRRKIVRNFSFFFKIPFHPLPSPVEIIEVAPVALVVVVVVVVVGVGISRRVASFTFINAYYVRAIFKSCVNRNSHWH